MEDRDWRKGDPNFQGPQLSRHLELAASLAEIGSEHGVSAGLVACAWVLSDPRVHGAIVGFRRPDQVAEILSAPGLRCLSEPDFSSQMELSDRGSR
jgi:aryl-alcohol dehydrogenase-like predicted oxidoreductase